MKLRTTSVAGPAPIDVGRWLRADARAVVRVAPADRSRTPAASADGTPPATLSDGLARWRGRVSRRRALALVRRQLTVAAGIAVLLEVVVLVVGAGRLARLAWLAAPAALALAGVAAGLRRRLGDGDVARMLDHDLALHERLGTAVELASSAGTAGTADVRTADGTVLAALVVAQARDALTASLSAARARAVPAGREWTALAVGVVAVTALVAVPGAGGAHPRSARHLASGEARPSGSASAVTRHSPAPAAHTTTTAASHGRRPPPLSFGNAQTPSGENRELAQGPSGGKTSNAAPPKQLAHGGNGELGPNGGSTGGQSGAGAGERSGSGGQASKSGAAGSAARGAGSSESGTHNVAGKAATGAKAGRTGSPNAPGTAGSAAKSAGTPGAFRSRQSPPGGDTAGHASGTTAPGPATTPRTKAGSAGLPIQSGYTPSTSTHSQSQGSGPAVSGGSGRARSAQAGGDGGRGSGSFPYIPPTASVAAGVDSPVLLSYFGPLSWVFSAQW